MRSTTSPLEHDVHVVNDLALSSRWNSSGVEMLYGRLPMTLRGDRRARSRASRSRSRAHRLRGLDDARVADELVAQHRREIAIDLDEVERGGTSARRAPLRAARASARRDPGPSSTT